MADILGMGTAGVGVRTMARQVAALIREHHDQLALDHLLAVPGMGPAKASQILSAFELARCYLLRDTVKTVCAQDVLPLVADIVAKPLASNSQSWSDERLAVVFVEHPPDTGSPAAGEDIFAELEPFTVKAGDVDYSRDALYSRQERE